MGKQRKKRSKLDFDAAFDSTKPASANEAGWHTGVSAMEVLDEAGAPQQQQQQQQLQQQDEPPSTSGTAAMDTADYVPLSKGAQAGAGGSLKVQKGSMKALKRGHRTTAQKKRKAKQQEKGLAFAEKIGVRASKKVARKVQVAGLKSLY